MIGALASCASNSEGGGGGGGSSSACTPAKAPSGTAKVPDKIKSAGKIVVGTDASYAPNEFTDSSNKIVGFDIDLFDAVAAKLGVKTEYQNSTFDNIIPGVTGGKYDIGVSSFTDNCEREKVVDFVTYFNAGTQWAAPAGKTVDPNNPCGLKVAVQTGTVQDTDDLPARIKKCKDAGKDLTVQKYEAQSDATTAVVLGKADAMLADSPITAYAVQQNSGKLQLAGQIYDAAPYGYAIPKSTPELALAIQQALKDLIADGTYAKVTAKWGVQAGAITDPKLNASGS